VGIRQFVPSRGISLVAAAVVAWLAASCASPGREGDAGAPPSVDPAQPPVEGTGELLLKKDPKKRVFRMRMPDLKEPKMKFEDQERAKPGQVDYGSFEVYQFDPGLPCAWVYRTQGSEMDWKEYWVLRDVAPGYIAPGAGWPEGFLTFSYLPDGFGIVEAQHNDAERFLKIREHAGLPLNQVTQILHTIHRE
jgi:hypothetical protein